MFFSVTKPIKIDGKAYIPCVCYPLPERLKYTVEQLKKEGRAEIYDKIVFFQNGKLVEQKAVAEDKKNKKKVKTVEVKNEEPAEEAVTADPEETDEPEGF